MVDRLEQIKKNITHAVFATDDVYWLIEGVELLTKNKGHRFWDIARMHEMEFARSTKAEKKLKIAREALEFYADPRSVSKPVFKVDSIDAAVQHVTWQVPTRTAREALKKIEGTPGREPTGEPEHTSATRSEAEDSGEKVL